MNQYARYAKSCMAALIFAAVACSSGRASAPAAEPTPAEESPCPQGPFETDRGKIVTAIASLPRVSTKPSRERRSSRQLDFSALANGVISEGGGGLPPPSRVAILSGYSLGWNTMQLGTLCDTYERWRRSSGASHFQNIAAA
jgi:hypothetical protein